MRKIDYIVLHTAAHGKDDTDYDTTIQDLRQWHVNENGWLDVGYHFLIRKDGTIEIGRPINVRGAHVRGLNSNSIGVCFSGHGDISPLTHSQLQSYTYLARGLLQTYNVPQYSVIGHREAYNIIGETTKKTCPGTKINMDVMRQLLIKG